MSASQLYQILYRSGSAPDPGFLLLDNFANERPDWYEYWPMRQFLLNQALDEDTFYGFFSPKFQSKTNLPAARIAAFIDSVDVVTDVVLFSPGLHNNAHFLNIFQHGDAKHPGLLSVAQELMTRLGSPIDLDTLVTDSRNEVLSNYFAAKPRFWRRWLELNEAMFRIAESVADPLGAKLQQLTLYRSKSMAPMKVFIMERMATLILATERGFVVRSCDAFAARSRLYRAPVAISSDALKIAYAITGDRHYRDVLTLIHKQRSYLNWQTRIGSIVGSKPIRDCLAALAAKWRGRAD